jgi:hypothetical protein
MRKDQQNNPQICEIMGHLINLSEIDNPHIVHALKNRLSFVFGYGERYEQSSPDSEEDGWFKVTASRNSIFEKKESKMFYREDGKVMDSDEKLEYDHSEEYSTGWYP